jgi:four helix bundle protein
MTFEEWLTTVPATLTSDPLWRNEVYRLAVLAGDLAWVDVTKLIRDRRTLDLSGQLYEAVGSVSANIAEGYSRSSNKDRARFYEYALGSAREARDWYYKSRYTLPGPVAEHRMELQTRIIKLLLTIVPAERGRTLSKEQAAYAITPDLFFEAEIPFPDATEHETRNTESS